MKPRRFRSFAKINLGLEVLGKRSDGYHELKTIFATIDLHDVVEIRPAREGISVRSSHPAIDDDETNLAHRAAVAMQGLAGTKRGMAIRVQKNIAVGGGLGGGSSNAATVLRALDRMWGLNLGPRGLFETARSLGADVPYFLFGGPALGLSRGDDIHPLSLPLKERVLLIQGPGGLSTAAVFGRFTSSPTRTRRPKSPIDSFVRSWEAARAGRGAPKGLHTLGNDLEATAAGLNPELMSLSRLVRSAGRSNHANHVAMSGSGTSFFALFDGAAEERRTQRELGSAGIKTVRCRFLSKRAYASRFEIKSR